MGNIITSLTKSNQTTLIIKITNTYKISCSFIDSNNKETIIQLKNKSQQDGYLLSSSLINNKSSIS